MIDRWLPPNHRLKRKVAFYTFLVLGAAFVVVTPWDRNTNEETEEQNAWVQRSWVPSWCLVRRVGVADHGACDGLPPDDLGLPTLDECPRVFPASRGEGTAGDNHSGSEPAEGTGSDCDSRGNAQYRPTGPAPDPSGGLDTGDPISAGDSNLGQQDDLDDTDIDEGGDASSQSDSDDIGGDAFESFDDMDTGRRVLAPGCQRRYLPWAEVLVSESRPSGSAATANLPRRCAYQLGAPEPSESRDGGDAANKFGQLQAELAGQGMHCWFLAADDCVVAFAMGEAHEEEEGEHNEETQGGVDWTQLRMCVSIFCGVVSVISAAMACYWYVLDYGFYNIIPPGGYQFVVSSPDDYDESTQPVQGAVQSLLTMALTRMGGRSALETREEVPLSGRIRRIVDVAAAGALGVMTPSSGGETLRLSARGGSRRTVQIAGPDGVGPRNIASDFLVGSDGEEPIA